MEEILKIYVELEETFQVKGNTGSINMIRFKGWAKSKYFEGQILPGAVDTQCCKNGEANLLSARYIMEGKDEEGNKCRIYIENNGYEDENGVIKTKPIVYTDSKILSWLETSSLDGSVSIENDMVVIRIHK